MLTLNEMILFTFTGLFVGGAFIWLLIGMINYGAELIREFTRKYFPAKYYYDYDEEA